MHPVPEALTGAPFTIAYAASRGLSREALRGRRFRTLFRGVHACASLDLTLDVWLRAALLVLPADATVSHTTALRVREIDVGRPWPLHFSTNAPLVTKQAGVVLHRRRGRLSPSLLRDLPVLGPDRTLVDCATVLPPVALIQAAETLVHRGETDLATLRTYAETRHLDGVVRARRWLAYVRERVESPMETLVRLLVVFAHLPEPDTNRDIHDADGRWIARGDLPYFAYRVLLEYDGQWHEREAAQRQRDRERREQLEAAGWRVIVVTGKDLPDKREIVWRVYRALRQRGYAGPPPVFNAMWTRWFAEM